MKKTCVGLISFLRRQLTLCVMLVGVLSLTTMSLSGFAQGKTEAVARGTVVDQSGKPVAGVAVMIKGASIGTVTDANGKYELELNNHKNVVLVFSMLGMKRQEISYRNSNPIVVRMEESTESVDEVVVTGYQKIDKRQLSSSIVSIKGADLVGGAQMSLDRMLVGRLPGVAVTGLTSTPGAAPKIRIRGQSSITGNREPVWVLDGIILEEPVNISAEELNSPDYVNLIGNAIGSVNPEDIERVDILKDASATAIYGVKAANGVIVVTTKKGTKGAPQVNYTTTLTVTTPPTYDKMFRMNSADRIDMSIEMQNRGLEFSSSTALDVGYEGALQRLWNREIDYPEFLSQVNTLRTNNTDWYGELFRTAFSQQHSLSVSGGNEKTDYYFSGGYANDKSVTIGENVDRYTAMIKLNTQLARTLKVGFKLSGSMSETSRPHTSVDMYQYAYNTSRAIPLYNPDGSLSFYTGGQGHQSVKLPYNILNEVEHGGYGNTNTNLALNINLDWDIAPWIKYSTVLGLSRNQNNQETWADEQSFYISQMRGLPYGSIVPLPSEDSYANNFSLPYGGELINENTANSTYTWRNSLALFKNFGKHELSANLGQEVRSAKYDGVKTTQYGYLPDRGKKFVDIDPTQWPAYAKLLRSHPDVIRDTKDNILSYYATATYAYDGRYIANFNIRTDGSNKFGQDPSVRFLPVWSVSGRWNIANEKFFEPLLGVFNDLSIRGSYGIQGNVHPDQTPNLITSLGTLDGMTQEYIATLSKYPNTKLRWEKTNSYNLAVDFALFNNRIYGSFDYYYKKGKDQVVQKTLAPSTGADYVAINEGDVENKGWDLSVSFVPVQTKNWTWHVSFNTGKNYNRVLNAGEDQSITWSDFIDGSLVVNGSALNSFYSYRFNKLDGEGYPTFFGTDQTDDEGNAIVHSQQEAFDRVFAYSGKRDPDLTGGFSTYVRYKRFTFNCLFSFSFGNKVRLNDLYESAGQSLPAPDQNMSSEFVNRWQKPGDENFTNIPVLSQDALTIRDDDVLYRYANNMWDMYNKSDLRVVSGSYLRCRSMSLRYDFDPKLLKKVYMKGASVSFDAGNVFVIKSKDLQGRDPEQLELGSRTVPPQRSYSLRLSITF